MGTSRFITTLFLDKFGSTSIALPPEALDALGVGPGSELEVEIVGRALVIRAVEEARRSGEFMSSFESILSRRRSVYDGLAKRSKDRV